MSKYLIPSLLAVLIATTSLTVASIGIFSLGRTAEGPTKKAGMVFEGYNFNSWGMALIALRNVGDGQITIKGVFFDGQQLAEGVVGVPTTHGKYMMTVDGSSKTIDTLEMIFPVRNHYNLANYATNSSAIPPSGFVILYLSVDAPPVGTQNEVKIITDQEGTFSTMITSGETANFKQP